MEKQCFSTVFYMIRNEPFLPHTIIYPIIYQAQIGVKKLKISIYSRKSIEKLLEKDFPENAVVISFYDPPGKFRDAEYRPVDYSAKTNCVFQAALHDIDLAVLPKYHLTYETYFPEVDDLAEFIFNAKKEGKDITILTIGVTLYKALEAAKILEEKYGISAEVIDARSKSEAKRS